MKWFGFVACIALLNAEPARAATYNMSITSGSAGVTGFIETDGTLGVLSAANITDWNLLLNNGVSSINIGPLSDGNPHVIIYGPDLTATTNGLFFNFSGKTPGSYVEFF